jgi:hypothetical protein
MISRRRAESEPFRFFTVLKAFMLQLVLLVFMVAGIFTFVLPIYHSPKGTRRKFLFTLLLEIAPRSIELKNWF